MNSNADYKSLIDLCEASLRAGKIAVVEQAMVSLNTARIPHGFRLPLARICRRASLIATGMRILTPIVRSDKAALAASPTAQEQAEYAVLLIRSGAIREALGLLTLTDAQVAPEALLYQAFACFSTWDYADAVTPLEKYLQANLEEYPRFIGRVNLAAAYVGTGRTQEGHSLLTDNIAYAKEHGHSRLLANCLELRAQVHVQRNKFAPALKDLEEAAGALGVNQANDQLFVRKWRAVVEALKSGDPAPLEAFRVEALRRREWESCRDTDFQRLRVRFRQDEFDHLYFGTPFAAYREKLVNELKARPSTGEFQLGQGEASLHLDSGKLGNIDLKGRTALQVVEILLRDFYRPLTVGGLFAALYPEEYFNIFSSPDRVHQALRRTRSWLDQNSLPVVIQADRGQFRIELREGLVIRLPQTRVPMDARLLKLYRLRKTFGDKEYFSPQEILKHTQMSRASVKRLLTWAVAQGHIRRFGEARATRYHFVA